MPLKEEKWSPESTYSVLNSVSIENGPCHSNLQFCVFHFNLSYTVASVLSFWEQTFFTGVGKIMECVQVLLQALWVIEMILDPQFSFWAGLSNRSMSAKSIALMVFRIQAQCFSTGFLSGFFRVSFHILGGRTYGMLWRAARERVR